MKRLFTLALFLSAVFSSMAFAQSTQGPDCVLRYSFTGTGNSATFTNYTSTTGMACAYWLNTYATNGTVNSLSMVTQAAPGGTTPTMPGTFVTYPGMALAGAITNTAVAGASAFLWNDAASVPFIRQHMTTLSCTGACLVYGVLQGWNEGNAAGAAAAAGGGGSGCPNPCPVVGVAADGAPVSGAPVRVGGKDGSGNTEDIITDTSGRLDPAGASSAQSDGATNTPTVPTANGTPATIVEYPYVFNGATWDRQFYATIQAPSSVSAGTDVVIAAGTAAKITRLVHFDFIWDTSSVVTIRQGSGTTCGSSTATLAGPYPSGATLGLIMDYSPLGALTTTATGLDICLHFGTAVTGGGFAKYQQF